MSTNRTYIQKGNHDVLFMSVNRVVTSFGKRLIVFEGKIVKSNIMTIGTEIAYIVNTELSSAIPLMQRIMAPCLGNLHNTQAIEKFLNTPMRDILCVKAFAQMSKRGYEITVCDFKPFLPKASVSLGKSLLCRLGGDEF